MGSTEKGTVWRSGRGATGGGAGSHRIDYPYRGMGMLPIRTDGDPSMSFDVNASEIMQNMIMGDDDKKWYRELFKKQAQHFLTPRHTVVPGFDVGLNASFRRIGPIVEDHRPHAYGIFIPVPDSMVRQIETVYPEAGHRYDDSPLHITVLFIGKLDECQVESARETMNGVLRDFEPFRLDIGDVGQSDSPEGTSIFIDVHAEELMHLHYALRGAMETMGISVCHKYLGDCYRGHITLANLPPGECAPDLRFGGSWLVDRVELWSMNSPISVKLGNKACCLSCVMGQECGSHVNEDLTRAIDVGLDIVGLIPGIGEAADVLNAARLANRGEYLFAALSLISVIPALGDALGKGSKVAIALGKAGPYIKKIKLFLKANPKLVKGVFDWAEKDDKLGRHVPKMKEALETLTREKSEALLRDFISILVEKKVKKGEKTSPRDKGGKPLLTEPDDTDEKARKEKKKETDEFNAIGTGMVRGYTGPLKGPKRKGKKDASSFGGGKFLSKKRKRPKWAGPGTPLA